MSFVRFPSLFAVVAALSACGSSPAKEEAVASCLEQFGSNEAYCDCAIDYAFETLSGDDMAMLDRISSTDRDISQSELAEELGMDETEMLQRAGRLRDTVFGRVAEAREVCSDQL